MNGLGKILACIGVATVLWCLGLPYWLSLVIACLVAAVYNMED